MKNKKNRNETAPYAPASWTGPPVALFWDQSLVWGLICVETLRRLNVPFHLLSGEDIARGCLESYRVLLVPGGWAAHKVKALGEAGRSRIARFIEDGGSYMGFCGGAGLALSSPPALGLVPIERMGLSERLPSASGEVWIQGLHNHPAWEGLPRMIPVSVWWPSQFSPQSLSPSTGLAVYRAVGEDFRVADLVVADMESRTMAWEKWEKVYGINLNPRKLLDHCAILEVLSGKGRLILSYPHLETPEEAWGNRLFLNLLTYLDRESEPFFPTAPAHQPSRFDFPPGLKALGHFVRVGERVEELIGFGERHLLWRWRQPWLLDWRRGIRGLEYGTLAVSIRAILKEAETGAGPEPPADPWLALARELEEDVEAFCNLASCLLLEEKLAIQSGNLSKLGKVNETVDRLRGQLFGSKMNHGGLCQRIFDELDLVLLHILRRRESASGRDLHAHGSRGGHRHHEHHEHQDIACKPRKTTSVDDS